MIVSICGIDHQLDMRQPSLGLLNIHNKALYRDITSFMLTQLNEPEENDIVMMNDGERIEGDRILYIQDLYLYTFETKRIVDKIIKSYIDELNSSITQKNDETELYSRIVAPILTMFDLLEIDYDYKDELDPSIYSKMLSVSFASAEETTPVEKIKAIINIGIKILRKDVFVFNRVIPLLTDSEINDLNIYVRASNCYLLMVDYLDDSDVAITDNLTIGADFGAYSTPINDRI